MTKTRIIVLENVIAMQQKRKAREDDEDDQDVVQLALELGSIFNKSFDIKLRVRDAFVQVDGSSLKC